MIHNYKDWLNESLPTDKYFRTCLDTVILMCLGSFSPVDGNSDPDDKITGLAISMRPDLFNSGGPDLWVNCGDFDGKIDAELEEVEAFFGASTSNKNGVNDAFKEWGMQANTIQVGEVIVSLDLSKLTFNRTNDPERMKANAEAIVKFYEETQPEGLKTLEKKLGTHLTGKEYGI
jgi:hypothetical protein